MIQQLQAQDANVVAVIQAEHDKSKDVSGQDGNIIASALDAMDKKVSQVSELVRKFDGNNATPIGDCNTPFTRAMSQDMRLMHDKLANIDVTALADMY